MRKLATIGIARLETATFGELVLAKIALRKRGKKRSLRYANIETAMMRRFGRT